MIKKIAISLNLLILINTNMYSMHNNTTGTQPFDFANKSLDQCKIIAMIEPWKVLGIKKNSKRGVARGAYKALMQKHLAKSGRNKHNDIAIIFKLAYHNIIGKRIKKIDEYVIIKKLYEIAKKKHKAITNIDKCFLDWLKMTTDLEMLTIDLKSKNHEDLAEFLSKNRIGLYKTATNINDLIINLFSAQIYATMLNIVNDIVTSFNELYRISALGSRDAEKIKRAAKIGQFFHVLSKAGIPVHLAMAIFTQGGSLISDYFNCKILPTNKATLLEKLFNVLPGISAFKFAKKDAQIQKNAEKIAQYNKETNRNLTTTKLQQLAWFAINKIAPYAATYMLYEARVDLTKHKYKSYYDCEKKEIIIALQNLNIFKAISNISEIARKHYRYKAEMGDYQSYKANA